MFGGFEPDPLPVDPGLQAASFTTDDVPLDLEVLRQLADQITAEVPAASTVPVAEHRGGLFTMSPDGRFVAGPVSDMPGLWVASGCNGSGFSSSLAIGEALATWITSEAPPARHDGAVAWPVRRAVRRCASHPRALAVRPLLRPRHQHPRGDGIGGYPCKIPDPCRTRVPRPCQPVLPFLPGIFRVNGGMPWAGGCRPGVPGVGDTRRAGVSPVSWLAASDADQLLAPNRLAGAREQSAGETGRACSRRIRRLAGHFRDTLRHSTRRAQGHVRITKPPGHNGAAIAYALVIGVCRTARAVTARQSPASAERPASTAARTAGSSLSSASEVAVAIRCRHSPSAAVAACQATANCRAGLSALPAMTAFSHLPAAVASPASRNPGHRGRT